jgi:uncharacterized OsmC-like protein
MGEYYATARLADNRAAVHLSTDNVTTVSPCQGVGAGGGCPIEHVLAALGSCIVLTLSAVAAHKKIRLQKLDVRVGCMTANGDSPATRFRIHIDLGNGLSQRERAILINSARHCEVGKILTGAIDIEIENMSS